MKLWEDARVVGLDVRVRAQQSRNAPVEAIVCKG